MDDLSDRILSLLASEDRKVRNQGLDLRAALDPSFAPRVYGWGLTLDRVFGWRAGVSVLLELVPDPRGAVVDLALGVASVWAETGWDVDGVDRRRLLRCVEEEIADRRYPQARKALGRTGQRAESFVRRHPACEGQATLSLAALYGAVIADRAFPHSAPWVCGYVSRALRDAATSRSLPVGRHPAVVRRLLQLALGEKPRTTRWDLGSTTAPVHDP